MPTLRSPPKRNTWSPPYSSRLYYVPFPFCMDLRAHRAGKYTFKTLLLYLCPSLPVFMIYLKKKSLSLKRADFYLLAQCNKILNNIKGAQHILLFSIVSILRL